tara:strand:- start:355 stop:762 length:408 start_codon:yes stop_codon:yes gene_type:complete
MSQGQGNTPIKALTVCQPFAHLIAVREKPVENRTWFTAYRGPLAIHAGKSREHIDEADPVSEMTFGAVIAMARLVDVCHIDDVRRGRYDEKHPWLAAHEHTFGPYCWVLANVKRIEPVPCRGALGLWNWTTGASQ